jgi:hypothetical protein
MRDDQMMLGVDGDLEVVAYDARASAARRHRTGIRIGQRYLHAPFRVLVNGGRSKWAHPTCRCMAYIRPQTRSGSTSELGQSRRCDCAPITSALPRQADILEVCCMSQRCHERTWALYSITSSASASKVAGRVRPSDFPVVLLMMSSKVVGSSIGRSFGAVPFNILST